MMSEGIKQSREQQSPDVVAYRLSVLESEVKDVDRKLDSFISLYPSKEILDIMLEPLKQTISGVEGAIKALNRRLDQQEQAKAHERTQLKLIVVAAVISPVASIVISLVIGMNYR